MRNYLIFFLFPGKSKPPNVPSGPPVNPPMGGPMGPVPLMGPPHGGPMPPMMPGKIVDGEMYQYRCTSHF